MNLGMRFLVSLISALLPIPAVHADGGVITGMTVSPAVVQPNQQVWVTVQGSLPPNQGCTVMTFTNGAPNGASSVLSFPLTNARLLPVPGTYTIEVKGDDKSADPKYRCSGQAKATITVRNLAPTQALGHQLKALAPPRCPPGTKLKHQNAATGAFTCVLDKSNKPTCPPGTQYFETDCEFGCREVPR